MSTNQLIVILVAVVGAGAILASWMRRDRGIVPKDRLPEALHEPLNGRQHS